MTFSTHTHVNRTRKAFRCIWCAEWLGLKAWAETRSGAWVAMANKGTHWESTE
jgi:hypothetical protein